MTAQQLRPLVLALLALLSAAGWLAPELRDQIQANADAILAGVLAVWAIVAHTRNRRDARTATPSSAPIAPEPPRPA